MNETLIFMAYKIEDVYALLNKLFPDHKSNFRAHEKILVSIELENKKYNFNIFICNTVWANSKEKYEINRVAKDGRIYSTQAFYCVHIDSQIVRPNQNQMNNEEMLNFFQADGSSLISQYHFILDGLEIFNQNSRETEEKARTDALKKNMSNLNYFVSDVHSVNEDDLNSLRRLIIDQLGIINDDNDEIQQNSESLFRVQGSLM